MRERFIIIVRYFYSLCPCMISTFFTCILIGIVCFFPVVIWAYIFTYIDASHLSKKRLLSGVFAGALSVAPILYMQEFLDFLRIDGIDVFTLFTLEHSFYNLIPAFLSLFLFLSIFVFFSFLTQIILRRKLVFSDNYTGSILVFLGWIIGVLWLFCLMNFIPFLSRDTWTLLSIEWAMLNSLTLVIWYYAVIALLEEWSKHFQFLSGDIVSKSMRKNILYAIFIALGFAFVENILYTYFLYTSHGFSSELLKLYFFRWVFSIILHILCTCILAYSSLRAFHFSMPRKTQIFIIWFTLSLLLHAVFDIALTLGFPLVLIIYFVWWYLYVSSLFYGESLNQ